MCLTERLRLVANLKTKIMITEKEYLEAKMIIKLYESQKLNIPIVSKSAVVESSGDFRDDNNRESQSEYFGKW